MTTLGKQVVDDLYVHLSAGQQRLSPDQWAEVSAAIAELPHHGQQPNVIKFNLRTGRFSLLVYPQFDASPFPELSASWTKSESGSFNLRTYDDSLNPPVLHRKELLVPEDWPARKQWLTLTKTAESIGLFNDTRAIGFRLNWERLIASKGYRVVDHELLPVGNDISDASPSDGTVLLAGDRIVQRHLTALSRSNLSAPVQLLLRSGLLSSETSFFDYGCGRGGDMAGLAEDGYQVSGWDPYYAPENSRVVADVVNLGFVVNVIEDPGERVDAITSAAALCRRVLAISVMLFSNEISGRPYRDGFISSRNTFQKYFSQGEFKDYLEHVLSTQVVMAGPGIAFAFIDKDWEQRYLSAKYRRRDVVHRLLDAEARRRRPLVVRAKVERQPRPARAVGESRPPREPSPPRLSKEQLLLQECRPLLDALWSLTLDLGRWPETAEISNLNEVQEAFGSVGRARSLLAKHYDQVLLDTASQARRDDLLLFLVTQQFSRRMPYRRLEERLQREIKAFFGDYGQAQAAAIRLLRDTADAEKLLNACKQASERGLGWLEADHSLQLHVSMVERLPVLLRAYVTCGLVLWDATSDVQLIKIHVQSGKLTLMEYEGFDAAPLPLLKRRIKVNLRKLDYDIFEYGTPQHPAPLLYRKSRYLNEDYPGYPEQLAFDEALEGAGVLGESDYGPSAEQLAEMLNLRRLQLTDGHLMPSERIPDLDQQCGTHFRFRDFVECGETQARTGIKNVPLNPATYNALYDLATNILDPVIEYFGSIRLTYGFCSPELGKHIKARVAPKLDQHAGCELGTQHRPVCDRGGISCDFVVQHESMREVADWIIENLPFDRLYFYADDRPVHVSHGPQNSHQAYALVRAKTGAAMPRPYRKSPG